MIIRAIFVPAKSKFKIFFVPWLISDLICKKFRVFLAQNERLLHFWSLGHKPVYFQKFKIRTNFGPKTRRRVVPSSLQPIPFEFFGPRAKICTEVGPLKLNGPNSDFGPIFWARWSPCSFSLDKEFTHPPPLEKCAQNLCIHQ